MNDVLISMNALKRFIQENGVVYSNKLDKFAVKDAVRIVRCKNCKHYTPYEKPVEDFDGKCFVRECETDEEEYCSYGERKETYDSM